MALSLTTYAALRDKVRETFFLGRQKIEKAKVQTYWQTGADIHAHILFHKERADYGARVMERLAEDLGVGSRLLERALRFFRSFPEIPSAWTELTWSHYRALLSISDKKKRYALAGQAAKDGWVSRDLEIEVRNLLWDKRAEASDGKAPSLLPVPEVGPFYTYQVIRPESIHSHAAEPLLDAGFSYTKKLSCFTSGKFPAGAIVTSVKNAKGSYSLRSIPSSRPPHDLLYNYQAFVTRVIDGDTLKLEIDIGFDGQRHETIRLKGIDCPEIDTPEGKAAKRFVERELAHCDFIILKSTQTRKEKWGRYLGDIFYTDKAGKQQYLNNRLLETGHAVRVRE